MAFEQVKLTKSVEQSRGIFDKFIYRPANGDTIADMIAPGYFNASRFASEPDWKSSLIEVEAADKYTLLRINETGQAEDILAIAAQNVALNSIGLFATTVDQIPAGTGDANKIRINFGAGGNTVGNEFTVAPDGTITCNANSIQYQFELTARIGRFGGGGVAVFMGRFMYAADGIEANAVQIGDTFVVEIDNANTIWRENFIINFSPEIGSVCWFEVARDESGNNSGQILTVQPTGTLAAAGWGASNTAILEISKREAS